jgi:hypothetical protein
MNNADKAMRYDGTIKMLDDQLELDLFTVEAEAKRSTWTKQLLAELNTRVNVFVDVCDMTDDESLIAEAKELQTKAEALTVKTPPPTVTTPPLTVTTPSVEAVSSTDTNEPSTVSVEATIVQLTKTRQWPIAKQALAEMGVEELTDFRQLLHELEERCELLLEKKLKLANQTT